MAVAGLHDLPTPGSPLHIVVEADDLRALCGQEARGSRRSTPAGFAWHEEAARHQGAGVLCVCLICVRTARERGLLVNERPE